VLALRAKWLGERHWQTIDARYAAEWWQRLTKVPVQDREKVVQAWRANGEGVGLLNRGQYKEGLEKLNEALAIFRNALGADHPDTASSYNNLAACLQDLGQPARALPLHERALAIRRKARGEDHPDTAQSYNNVGSCLEALGQPARALPLFERALAICRKA